MDKDKNKESLELSTEILRNIELGEIPLSGVITKSIRLARLTGDIESLNWLRLELSGYGSAGAGVPPNEWKYGGRANRYFQQKDKNGDLQTLMRVESIGRIESEIEIAKIQLSVSTDPNVSVSSSNPNQYLFSPAGNTFERNNLRTSIAEKVSLYDKIKSSVYEYVLTIYYQLKFGNITESLFESTRNRVNLLLTTICPEAVKELVAAYDNIMSSNESDWSNSANSCRRLLVQVANTLSPPLKTKASKKESKIKLTEDAYINRLVRFIESKSKSDKFNLIVGSHLKYIGDRLDSINSSSAKGLHNKISKEEAGRLIIYTYLCVGDILTLVTQKK